MRQLKREVKIGNVTIGGNHPIAVQTMLNVPVEDIAGNVAQAKRCEAAGCQILRVTCPSAADAKCIEAVKNAVSIPIVADIHFDYRAALACADVGVDKIRINPGNIGDDDRVKAVVDACQQKNIPIRIGVNGGSLEKHILAKYGAPTPEAMVESALYHVRLLEKFDFNNIVISIKNSNVPRMMEAYRQLSAVTDYPLHVGVTDAAALVINGSTVAEPDIYEETPKYGSNVTYPLTLADGEYFILCDARAGARDSRWFGPVQAGEIQGRVIAVLRRNGI